MVRESRATGADVDEVLQRRNALRAQHIEDSREVVEEYADAARAVRENGSPEDRLRAWAALEDVNRLGSGRPLDRREFLKNAARAAAAVAAASAGGATVLAAAGPAAAAAAPRVAIVGGGLAGLRVAQKLWTERGIRSTVYEANPEIGGRVETLRGFFDGGQIAEMHGEFINTEHTSVKALAARYGLGLDDLYATPNGTVDSFWINGGRYTEEDITKDWKAFGYDTFHSTVLGVQAPQTYANHNAAAAAIDAQDAQTWLTNNLPGGSSTRLYQLALESLRGEQGVPSDTSALVMVYLWSYNNSARSNHSYQSNSFLSTAGGDERWHVTGGNDQLVSGMVGELPAGTIQLSTAVLAVKRNSDGTYTLTINSGGGRNTSVVADHVVLAAPFSSLRANVDLSKAGLSAVKLNAIKNLGMSTHGKVLLQFDGHPWYANGFDGNMLVDSPTNWMWEQNFQAGNNTAPYGILLQYPSGPTTQSYVSTYGCTKHEGVAPAALVSQVLAPVNTFYGPGVKEAYHGKAWYHFGLNDPWVRGGYPFWRVGQVTGFSGIEGVQEGGIHFAGDACAWDFQGFMEGALRSAERVTSEI
ncbi:MAG TPA: FAD-dependent oxidoreductase [Candidatus Nanopelagicales bacterium]|nr:FAD-dependent oxidoreductase [Candidatus Nanopelagicales bacterium]